MATPFGLHLGAGEILVLLLLILAALYVLVRMIARFARPRSRPCPRCGQPVRNGVLECGDCGFDFGTVGQPQPERR